MRHAFSINVAKEYGVDAAIILDNFYFWIIKNKANKKHFYNNKYWMYNTQEALSELFPYWSRRQIQTRLEKMEQDELIEKGNFNKAAYDRTTWYTLTEKAYKLLNDDIVLNGSMDCTEPFNGLNETVQPIPDINTDINTDIKDTSSTQDENLTKLKEKEIIKEWNLLNLQQLRAIKNNTNRYKMLKARIDEYGYESLLEAIRRIRNSDFLKGQNNKNWIITFDWLIRPNNFVKVLEGNYDNKGVEKYGTSNGNDESNYGYEFGIEI